MKLSEAIRLAGVDHPQITDHYVRGDGTCALGGAYKVMGCDAWKLEDTQSSTGSGFMGAISLLEKVFPIAAKQLPGTFFPSHLYVDGRTVASYIVCMNDELGWSRHKIADEVERIENLLEAPQEEASDVCETAKR